MLNSLSVFAMAQSSSGDMPYSSPASSKQKATHVLGSEEHKDDDKADCFHRNTIPRTSKAAREKEKRYSLTDPTEKKRVPIRFAGLREGT